MRTTMIAALVIILLASGVRGEETGQDAPAEESARRGMPPGITPFSLKGGLVYQASAGLETDGDFQVDRFYIQPGVNMFFSREFQLSLGVGYSFDRYEFDGERGIAGENPWDDIHTLRFSAFARYALNEDWTLFGAPSLRFAAEQGAELSDGTTFGFFAGASVRLSEQLTIGPGAGFFSEIEDSASVFPFLLIDWEFAEDWAIRTGRGLAATRGPGLVLEWKFADRWTASLGGRWEQQRFRLDEDGRAPDGIGEEASVPVFLGLTRKFGEKSSVSLIAGMNFSGRLSLFDEQGDRLAREDYDPAPFVGVAFSLSF